MDQTMNISQTVQEYHPAAAKGVVTPAMTYEVPENPYEQDFLPIAEDDTGCPFNGVDAMPVADAAASADSDAEADTGKRKGRRKPFDHSKGEKIIDFPDVRHFLQVHFLTHLAQPKVQSFGYFNVYALKPKEGKNPPMRCFGGKLGEELEDFIGSTNFRQDHNYYITANSFRSPTKRNMDELFAMCNIVVDIDNHNDSPNAQAVFNDAKVLAGLIENRFAGFAEDRAVPGPNSIVLTGRGIQLWWAFIPTMPNFRDIFDILAVHYCNTLRDFLDCFPQESAGFSVDPGPSKNKVGLFRMPGTINPKVGIRSEVKVLSEEVHDFVEERKKTLHIPAQFKTDAMLADEDLRTKKWAEAHGETYTKRKRRRKSTAAADKANAKAGTASVAKPVAVRASKEKEKEQDATCDNFASVAWMRAHSLKLLVEKRKGLMTGCRDNFLWIFFNEMVKCVGESDAMRFTREINSQFSEPFTEAELLSSVKHCARAGISERSTIGYAIKNTTIINFLQITEEEQNYIGLHPAEENALNNSGFYQILRGYTNNCAYREDILRYFEIMRLMDLGFGPAELGRLFNIPRRTLQDVARYRATYYARCNELETRMRMAETYVTDRANHDKYVVGEIRKYCASVSEDSGTDVSQIIAIIDQINNRPDYGVEVGKFTPHTEITNFLDISRTVAALEAYEKQALEEGKDPYGWTSKHKGKTSEQVVAELKAILTDGSFNPCLGMAEVWEAPLHMAAGAETWLQNGYSIPVAGKTKTSAKCLTVVTTLPEQYKNASVNDDYEDSTTKTGTVIPFRRQEAYDEGSPCESGELQKNQITALGVGLPKVEWATGQEAGLSTYYQYIYSNIYITPPLTQQTNRIKAIKRESTSDLPQEPTRGEITTDTNITTRTSETVPEAATGTDVNPAAPYIDDEPYMTTTVVLSHQLSPESKAFLATLGPEDEADIIPVDAIRADEYIADQAALDGVASDPDFGEAVTGQAVFETASNQPASEVLPANQSDPAQGYWESLYAQEPTDLGTYCEAENGCMYHRDVVGDIPDDMPEGTDPEHDESYWESLYKEAPVDLGAYCEFEDGCLYHHDGKHVDLRDQDQEGYWESLFAQEPPYLNEQTKDDGCKHNIIDPYAVLKDIPTNVLEAELLRRKREKENRLTEAAKCVQDNMTRQAQVMAGSSAVSDLLQIGAGIITAKKYEAPQAIQLVSPYQPPVQETNPYQPPVVEQAYQPPVRKSTPYQPPVAQQHAQHNHQQTAKQSTQNPAQRPKQNMVPPDHPWAYLFEMPV